MQRAQLSELFWNAPHVFEGVRAVDPLGFDALGTHGAHVHRPHSQRRLADLQFGRIGRERDR